MTALIQVIYGRIAPERIADVTACGRCQGKGKAETCWRSGKFEECPVCHGAGHPERLGYTYSAAEPVGIGDVVIVPGNWLCTDPQEATVVALGSTYDGAVTPIRRILERAAP
jgi:hypothetical protein